MITNLLSKLYQEGKKHNQHSFVIDDFKFEEFLNNSNLFPHFLWRSRDHKLDILALGKKAPFTTNTPPNNHIVGGQSFVPTPLKEEWAGFESNLFYIPHIIFERTPKQTTVTFYDDPSPLERQEQISHSKKARIIQNIIDLPDKDHFLKLFTQTTTKMQQKKIEKVVLAKKKIYTTADTIDPVAFFNDTKPDENGYQLYFRLNDHKAFISFSPECLFSKKEEMIFCDSMAGTAPIQTNSQDLEQSFKNRKEQHLVTTDVEEKLKNLCHDIKREGSVKIHKLKHLQHLVTTIRGTLKSKTCWTTILKQLHPTAAVGGSPWPSARKIIEQTEPFTRGFYAAPWGVIGPNYCEFLVGIRSVLIDDNKIHLFAGAGIVEESKGEEEWQEMESKMLQFIQKI